jgi:MoxR-like ATPase
VLTSNNARELSDALKRRCLHLYIDYPTRERELSIVRSRLPGVPEKLATQVVNAVGKLRKLELKKAPSIAETLDWAQALVLLNADTLSAELVAQTLNLVVKHEVDVQKAKAELHALIAKE